MLIPDVSVRSGGSVGETRKRGAEWGRFGSRHYLIFPQINIYVEYDMVGEIFNRGN